MYPGEERELTVKQMKLVLGLVLSIECYKTEVLVSIGRCVVLQLRGFHVLAWSLSQLCAWWLLSGIMILTFSTKFQVNWPFGSGEEVKNRFSRWRQIFEYLIIMAPVWHYDSHVFYQLPSQLAFWFRRRSEK